MYALNPTTSHRPVFRFVFTVSGSSDVSVVNPLDTIQQISADMRNFVHVNNYVLKAEHTPELEPLVIAKLRAAAGLVFLEAAEYAKVRLNQIVGM